MRIKRLIAVLVCAAMVFGVIPGMTASAAVTLEAGKCGEFLTWKLQRYETTGNLYHMSIDGLGRMYDYPSWGESDEFSLEYLLRNADSVNISGASNIGKSAFSGWGISRASIGSSVYEIGSRAFFGCNNLKDIFGGLSVSTIGNEAFYGCRSLTNVALGEYVRDIGTNAFLYCDSLEKIIVDEKNKYYTSQEGVLFDKNLSTLKIYPTGKTEKEYRIPNGIIKIEDSAFIGCGNLTSISIPKSVTEINQKAFLGCNNLTEVYYDGSKEEFEAITIESKNDILTNANIHYADSSSAPSVTLNKTEIEIAVGESETLMATVELSNATNKSVTWKSSNTDVATVENGVVKAVKAGTATITVTMDDGGKNATCAVTVVNPTVAVTGVSFNKTTAKMTVGDSTTLTATVAPSNATNKSLTWKSSNTDVATVDNGVVKAITAGSATITVTTADGGKTASCAVTVTGNEKYKLVGNIQKYVADCSAENIAKYGDFESDAYESVFTAYNDGFKKLNPSVWAIDTENVYEGKRALKNIASGRGSNSDNNFFTSFPIENGKIYLVSFMEYCAYEESSGYGRMTAVIATDTPTNTDGFIECGGYSSWYNATNHIDPRDRIIKAGWNEQSVIIDTSKNADAKYISVINCWGTENENYAIDNFMIYEITESQSYTPVTGVSLSETSKSLFVGESADVNASVVPSNASVKDVIWSSSDENVATVKNGEITAVRAGSATITVTTADGGKTASCAVTVVNSVVAVTGVSLNKTTAKLTVEDSETLMATVTPSNATNKGVTWKSSNTTVATVENGVVKAVKAGSATITVTTADGGKTASCAVIVVNPTVAVTGVSLNKTTVNMTVGESTTLTATVAPSNATNKSVTWKSSNTAVATVENGVVKAVKAGTATITVTTADGGKTASCVVTVEEKSAQYSADITAGNASGRAGDTVTVPVVISNNPGIAAFKVKVTYDKERLVPVSITKGSILSGAITSNIQQGGDMTRFDYVTVYWDNPSDFTADGELFNVVFKIADSAEEGDIPVGISYVKGEVANQKYEDVDLNITEGNVSVRNVMMGDIFEDGEVNSKDGLKLRQYLAEWAVSLTEMEKAAADVFNDGEINSKDGLKLRQYLAEWDVTLEMMSLMGSGSISFEAGSASAASGEYVDIPINITENSGVAVFNLRVEFDKEKLIPVSITKGDALSGVITSNIQQGGDMERFDYVTAYWDNPSNVTGTGTAFTVRFKVKDGAKGEAPIRLTSKAGDICDQSFNDLEVKFSDGAVTIGGGEVKLPYTVNSFETEKPSNGRVYARISVTKNEERAGADALVIAVYNKNGELIDTSAMQGVFEKGQTMTFRGRVFYEEGCTMKAFVWESFEDMVPISNVIEH